MSPRWADDQRRAQVDKGKPAMPPYREVFVTPADLEVQPSWLERIRAALRR